MEKTTSSSLAINGLWGAKCTEISWLAKMKQHILSFFLGDVQHNIKGIVVSGFFLAILKESYIFTNKP